MLLLKTAAVIAALVLIVPLAVWGGTGSRGQAWFALKRYLLVMGLIVALGGGVALLTLLPLL